MRLELISNESDREQMPYIATCDLHECKVMKIAAPKTFVRAGYNQAMQITLKQADSRGTKSHVMAADSIQTLEVWKALIEANSTRPALEEEVAFVPHALDIVPDMLVIPERWPSGCDANNTFGRAHQLFQELNKYNNEVCGEGEQAHKECEQVYMQIKLLAVRTFTGELCS